MRSDGHAVADRCTGQRIVLAAQLEALESVIRATRRLSSAKLP